MRIRYLLAPAAAILVVAGVSGGCAHGQKTGDDDKPALQIPADSPLAKVKKDMTEAEVVAILGPCTASNGYLGGKAFNPFNFGGDSGAMVEAHYKGLGRVVYNVQRFTVEKKVDNVAYDPAESGASN